MKREKEVFGSLRDLRRDVVAKANHENPRQGMKAIIYKISLSMTPCHVTSSKCTSGEGRGTRLVVLQAAERHKAVSAGLTGFRT
jgi:hypothetical protein